MSVGIVAVNLAVDTDGSSPLLSCLQNPDVGFHSVTEECADIYHAKLAELKEVKADSGEPLYVSQDKELHQVITCGDVDLI